MTPGWLNAKPRHPCPVCGRGDWCAFTVDGATVACRRESRGGHERTDRGGGTYYLHRLGPGTGPREPLPPPCAEPTRGDADALHRAYSALLGGLRLDQRHAENLRARGLYADEQRRNGYRSLPGRHSVGDLSRRLGPAALLTVPGFVRREGAHGGFVSLAGGAGMLIPSRDATGRIQAMRVRLDDPGQGGRYRYLSSNGQGGAGPVVAAHVPAGTKPAARVRVVEGELKADVAAVVTGQATIAIPGVATWATALPVLAALGAGAVTIALDADAETNPQVAGAVACLAAGARGAGLVVSLERWPLAVAKGLDDLLMTGGEPATITGRGVDAEIDALLRSAEAARGRARASGGGL